MDTVEYNKLSGDLRTLARLIPLRWGRIQNNRTDDKINMFQIDSFDELESVFNGHDKFVVDEIPLGVVFNNALMRNFGPKIQIRLDIVGDVLSELETEVKPYGINNALVEVRVKLNANARVILPLTSKEINVTNVIPLSINIVSGSIPEAYIATYK